MYASNAHYTDTGTLIPPERKARCPSCGQQTQFSYSGVQRWPKRVAEAAGINPVVYLWNCQSCQSTISEQNLQ